MLNQLVDLQDIVYSDKRKSFSANVFRHWYLQNPNGDVISFNAFDGGKIIAHYACVPIKMNIGGEVHSGLLDMATVTHPSYRGKGLFRTLAKTTYDYAASNGFDFVIGVANENSFPGYMKYFDFKFVSKLDVKIGIGKIKLPSNIKTFSVLWDDISSDWRLDSASYFFYKNNAYGKMSCLGIHNVFGIKAILGCQEFKVSYKIHSSFFSSFLRPFNMYIGLGADFSSGLYVDLPKFVKHSPFNLIFLDLSKDKHLPSISRNNVFFQLMDFDVL
jgi:GNAT superfamily N-acetyltransferase